MHQKLSLCEQSQKDSLDDEKLFIDEGKNIAVLQGRLSKRMRDSALIDIALRISLTAAAIITLTGTILAFAALPPFVAAGFLSAGVVSGLIASGGMLFKCGFGGPSHRDFQEASQMQHSVRIINQAA